MSGATVPYNLRQNKHVERQVFTELLGRFSQWRPIIDYLYVGFGGVYFEDFKLLHNSFGIDKMVSLESESWMIPRQEFNLPFGCIKPHHRSSDEFIRTVEQLREQYSAGNIITWLDYAKPSDLPAQLSEVRALIPKLIHGDILKVTLSSHTYWLDSAGVGGNKLTRRLTNLREKLGSTYLADGLNEQDVRDEQYPNVLRNALRKQIAEGLEEQRGMEFMPIGCYVYSDGTPMITMAGSIVDRKEVADFEVRTALKDMPLSSTNWELHNLRVPNLSLREQFRLDSLLFEPGSSNTLPKKRTAEEIAEVLSFRFDNDETRSLELIENYIKLYRYHPNYHRVQI